MVAVAVAAWIGLETSTSDDLTRLLRMVVPLAVAVVLGAGIGSPFGEVERTASLSLPPVRLGHIALILALGGLILALAGNLAGGGGTDLILRNGAGFAGLALVGTKIFGAGAFWAAPLGYAGAVFTDFVVKPDRDASWRWPVQPADDGAAWAFVLAFLAVGLGLAVRDTGWAHRRLPLESGLMR